MPPATRIQRARQSLDDPSIEIASEEATAEVGVDVSDDAGDPYPEYDDMEEDEEGAQQPPESFLHDDRS